MKKHSQRLGKQIQPVEQKAVNFFRSYSWPGNIRELENIVERAVLLSTGGKLELELEGLTQEEPQREALRPLQEIEKEYLLRVLSHTGGVIHGEKGAAWILGMHPNTLRSRMQRLGILFAHPRQKNTYGEAAIR